MLLSGICWWLLPCSLPGVNFIIILRLNYWSSDVITVHGPTCGELRWLLTVVDAPFVVCNALPVSCYVRSLVPNRRSVPLRLEKATRSLSSIPTGPTLPTSGHLTKMSTSLEFDQAPIGARVLQRQPWQLLVHCDGRHQSVIVPVKCVSRIKLRSGAVKWWCLLDSQSFQNFLEKLYGGMLKDVWRR